MKNSELTEVQTQFETINSGNVEITVSCKTDKNVVCNINANNGLQKGNTNSPFINLKEFFNYIIDSFGYKVYIGTAKCCNKYILTDSIKLSVIKAYKENSEQEVFVIRDSSEEIFHRNYPGNTDIETIADEVIEVLNLRSEVEAYRLRRYNS